MGLVIASRRGVRDVISYVPVHIYGSYWHIVRDSDHSRIQSRGDQERSNGETGPEQSLSSSQRNPAGVDIAGVRIMAVGAIDRSAVRRFSYPSAAVVGGRGKVHTVELA